MIKVKVKDKHIEIKGHALFKESGKDIVCASVSSIVITSVNAILKFDAKAIDYEEKDGYIRIDVLHETNEVKTIITNMLELLKELEKDYSKNVKIYEEV